MVYGDKAHMTWEDLSTHCGVGGLPITYIDIRTKYCHYSES